LQHGFTTSYHQHHLTLFECLLWFCS
jgi:hypothetical protein